MTPQKQTKSKHKWIQSRQVGFQEAIMLPRSGQSPTHDGSLQCVTFECFHTYFGVSLVFTIDASTHLFSKVCIIFIQA